MSRLDVLKKNYVRICGMPWDKNVAGPQRVWLAVYDKEDERKLRHRIALFEEATHSTGHGWQSLDLTDVFAEWLLTSPYRNYAPSYFATPSRLGTAQLAALKAYVVAKITTALSGPGADDNSVLAVTGVAGLFGFLQVSAVLHAVEQQVKGRLLVFFPGVYEQDNYRLLDARDGWNFLAIPITPSETEARR